jgi:hypothetical protein
MDPILVIKDEITLDPLGRGYTPMTDKQVADDMNTAYRDGPYDSDSLFKYLTMERFRTGTLYGRLVLVAGSRPVRAGNVWEIPPLPLGASDVDITITQTHIASASTFLRLLDVDRTSSLLLTDSRMGSILDDLSIGGCEALGPGDKATIQAMSIGQQTRAEELGIGRVREGHVNTARAL